MPFIRALADGSAALAELPLLPGPGRLLPAGVRTLPGPGRRAGARTRTRRSSSRTPRPARWTAELALHRIAAHRSTASRLDGVDGLARHRGLRRPPAPGLRDRGLRRGDRRRCCRASGCTSTSASGWARAAAAGRRRADHPYAAWIDTYADPAFAELTATAIALTDRAAAPASADQRARHDRRVRAVQPVRVDVLRPGHRHAALARLTRLYTRSVGRGRAAAR